MKHTLILLLASSCILSCGNESGNNSATKTEVPLYTLKDTVDIVRALIAYQDTSGESFMTHLESAPLDTISFIKNNRFKSTISFPTKKIIKYIPLPEGYPGYLKRPDQLDILFSNFQIFPDSASCSLFSRYINLIGNYDLKKENGKWKVIKYKDWIM